MQLVKDWVASEPKVALVEPESVSTAFIKLELKEDDYRFFTRLVKETGVLLVPGAAFGFPGHALAFDKGFEIVGVSMDNDKESWLQAIKDDGLGWIQLSDLNYWNTEPRELYNVSYIPQNVLVDSEGKIIASKLGEEELEEVLDEYLGE